MARTSSLGQTAGGGESGRDRTRERLIRCLMGQGAGRLPPDLASARRNAPGEKLGAPLSRLLGSRAGRAHALQLPKRIKRGERDEFEAHQVRLAERQLLEHLVRGSGVGYVEDERDSVSTLKREPLIDLGIEIELHRFADFVRKD